MNLIRPRNYPCAAPASLVNILVNIITSSRGLLLTATGIGLTSIFWLYLGNSGVTLEPPTQKLGEILSDRAATSVSHKLFVNPAVEAINGDGSENAPFKTITQALQVAQANNVIVLSPGTYSTDSGEEFPLKLKPSVSIQGNPQTRGSNITIKGGGTFISPTFARQNITILGANQATITGVTVTNPNPRGYGLWIESSSSVVSDNTFTGSSHDGISITGNSTSTIRNNYFYQNGANGITIYGTSRPEVRENVFEKTGYGVNIAQQAAPLLIDNRIIQNRAGILSQANSRPVLRNNVIEDNKEDGVVAIANSQPNLGTKAEPGGNVIRQNGRYDINSSASRQVIPAFGNKLANARTNGTVDLAGAVNLIATPVYRPPANSQLALNPRTTSTNSRKKPVILENSAPASSPSTYNTRSREIDIIVPPPATTEAQPPIASNPPSKKLSLTQLNPLPDSQPQDSNVSSNNQPPATSESEIAIEIPVPPASIESTTPSSTQNGSLTQGLPKLAANPTLVSEPLLIPSSDVPTANQPQPTSTQKSPESAPAKSPSQPPTKTAALSLRYRVVVEAPTATKQEKVRSIVPGAFRTSSKGKVLMQLGAFSDRAKAAELLQMVKSKGLKATIEQIN